MEAVQNRAIRWMMGFGPRQRCSISKLRTELEMRTLEERRSQQQLTLLFKMVNGDVVVTPDDLGLQSADTRTRSKHGHKFREKRARTNRLKFSPVFRTIAEWNKLRPSSGGWLSGHLQEPAQRAPTVDRRAHWCYETWSPYQLYN